MANSFVDVIKTANVIGTTFSNVTVKPLRPQYVFDAMAQERRWNLNTSPARGDALQFPVLSALSANTAALDPTTAALTGSQTLTYTRRSVSMDLYGDHMSIDVLELKPEAFVDIIDDAVSQMADQGMNSLNVLAKAAMDLNKYANETSGTLSGTYHYYASNATASTMGPLKAIDVRKVVADMKGDSVRAFEDGFYRAIVHPIAAQQLRAETGNAAWRAPQVYKDSVDEVFTGEVGEFEGVRFIVNSQITGSGTGTLSSYLMGRDFVGKAIGIDLRVKTRSWLGGNHENLLGIFWESLVGYKIIRREAGRIVEGNNSRI
jgi:N4-gp56 family major capsid protein